MENIPPVSFQKYLFFLSSRAIINHFNPKIESYAAVNHISQLSEEQVNNTLHLFSCCMYIKWMSATSWTYLVHLQMTVAISKWNWINFFVREMNSGQFLKLFWEGFFYFEELANHQGVGIVLWHKLIFRHWSKMMRCVSRYLSTFIYTFIGTFPQK